MRDKTAWHEVDLLGGFDKRWDLDVTRARMKNTTDMHARAILLGV